MTQWVFDDGTGKSCVVDNTFLWYDDHIVLQDRLQTNFICHMLENMSELIMVYTWSYLLQGPLDQSHRSFGMDIITSQQKKYPWVFSAKYQQSRKNLSSVFGELCQRHSERIKYFQYDQMYNHMLYCISCF